MNIKISIFFVLFFSIMPQGFSQKKQNQLSVKADSAVSDSVSYELVVLDPGFEAWLVTKPSMNFYSKEYYEIRNRIFVWEWNYRYDHPSIFGNLYDTHIDYDSFVDYGINLNYRLYNYFRYFEETNKIKLTDQFR
jgi:hypothetical protein